MRVVLTGASGLIGSAVLARLRAEGYNVIAVTRTGQLSTCWPLARRQVVTDIAPATRPEDWLPQLARVDAVVNCAGVLHAEGAAAPASCSPGLFADG